MKLSMGAEIVKSVELGTSPLAGSAATLEAASDLKRLGGIGAVASATTRVNRITIMVESIIVRKWLLSGQLWERKIKHVRQRYPS